jgi:hypothetical protein
MTEDQWVGMAAVVLLGLYVIPGLVARSRNHPHAMAIVALNVLAGWTVVGWIIAFVWALRSQPLADKALPELAPMHQCVWCGRIQLVQHNPCLSCGKSPIPPGWT